MTRLCYDEGNMVCRCRRRRAGARARPHAARPSSPARSCQPAARTARWRRARAGHGSGRRSRKPGGQRKGVAACVPEEGEKSAAPTVHDVLLAARRALEQARAHAQGSAVAAPDPYPLENLYRELEERLAALEPGRGVSTEEWFRELPAPQARCALLLALLELARLRRLLLGQREALGQTYKYRASTLDVKKCHW